MFVWHVLNGDYRFFLSIPSGACLRMTDRTCHSVAGAGVLHRLRNGLKMMVTPHGAIASVAGSSSVIDGKTFRQQSEDSCRQKGAPSFTAGLPLLFSRRAAAPTHLHPRGQILPEHPFGGVPQNDVIFYIPTQYDTHAPTEAKKSSVSATVFSGIAYFYSSYGKIKTMSCRTCYGIFVCLNYLEVAGEC